MSLSLNWLLHNLQIKLCLFLKKHEHLTIRLKWIQFTKKKQLTRTPRNYHFLVKYIHLNKNKLEPVHNYYLKTYYQLTKKKLTLISYHHYIMLDRTVYNIYYFVLRRWAWQTSVQQWLCGWLQVILTCNGS